MSDFQPDELIDRYLAGELDPETAARVRAYLDSTPGRRGFMAGIRAAARSEDLIPSSGDPAAGRARLYSALDTATWESGAIARRGRRAPMGNAGPTPIRRWGYAAFVAVAIALAFVGRSLLERPVHTPIARTYATATGQCIVVTLTDGSHVTMAPNSRLAVSETFGTHTRELWLTGHAQFDVRHADGHPFVVHTGDVSTRVLGTVFDIQRYPRDAETRVAVLSGKVAAGTLSRRPVTLVAGTIGHIGALTDSVVTAGDLSVDASWTHGTLVFRDTPLPEVLDALSRWYGLEFRVADPAIAHSHINGTFAGENRAEALLTMQSLLGAGMTFDSTAGGMPVVTIVPRRASQLPHRQAPIRDARELLQASHSKAEVGR